jgi:ribonuclease HI
VNAVACSLGVAGTGREPLRMSLRVGGQYSSTRAELVAIAAALRMTHTHPAVAFLVDSSAALQRMTWFRSKDFRPSPRKVKDLDVLMDIALVAGTVTHNVHQSKI